MGLLGGSESSDVPEGILCTSLRPSGHAGEGGTPPPESGKAGSLLGPDALEPFTFFEFQVSIWYSG